MGCKCASQIIDAAIGVTVQSQGAQAFTQSFLQRWRQAERVLHRIELDHADRILNGVGVHGLHILPNSAHELGTDGHGASLIGGTGFKRNSAARAWACRPSPYANSAAIRPKACAPASLTSIKLERF